MVTQAAKAVKAAKVTTKPKRLRERRTDKVGEVAGVPFIVRNVPAFDGNAGDAVDGGTADRFARTITRTLATLGVHNGAAFRALRGALRLRAADLAAMLDRTPETLSAWETGRTPVDRGAMATVAAMVRERAGVKLSVQEHLARMAAWETPREPVSIDYDPNA